MSDPRFGGNGSPNGQSLRLEELTALRKRSEAMILLAKKKAQDILEKSREESRILEEEAFKRGFEKGYSEGIEKGTADGINQIKQQAQSMMQEVDNHITEYNNTLNALMDVMEERIMTIVRDTVKKVINREIEEDDDFVLRTVKNAGERMRSRDVAQLMVHEEDIGKVMEKRLEIISGVDAISDLEICRGNKVSRGGCMVEALSGIVDARIESQLEAIDEIFDSV